MTLWWCTVRRLIPTHPSTIPLLGITQREWRSLSALAWQWERLGEEAGATTPDGTAETTPSTSITTIILSTTPTDRMSITVLLSSPVVEEGTIGSTILSTVAELRTGTRPRQTNTAVQPVGRRPLTVNLMRGNNNLVNRAVDSRPEQRIGAALVGVD